MLCRDVASPVMLVNVRSASWSVRNRRDLKRGSRAAAVEEIIQAGVALLRVISECLFYLSDYHRVFI